MSPCLAFLWSGHFDFDINRLALDMLNIKVSIGSLNVETTESIAVKRECIVTTQSWSRSHNAPIFPFAIRVEAA